MRYPLVLVAGGLLMRKLNNLLCTKSAIVMKVIRFYSKQKCVPKDHNQQRTFGILLTNRRCHRIFYLANSIGT